ncbi:unnamed protein product, partial [Iphiclides podalirius]
MRDIDVRKKRTRPVESPGEKVPKARNPIAGSDGADARPQRRSLLAPPRAWPTKRYATCSLSIASDAMPMFKTLRHRHSGNRSESGPIAAFAKRNVKMYPRVMYDKPAHSCNSRGCCVLPP